MRKLVVVFMLMSLVKIQAQEKTFGKIALGDTLITIDGARQSFDAILKEAKGKTVLIDIWASWCKDCVVGMPTVKKLKKEYPDVYFLYISLDKTEESWKKGIKRFEINNGVHYWAPKGWKSDLFTDIDLDWIPRYMVLNKEGTISLYKAIKATDKKIINQFKKLGNEK